MSEFTIEERDGDWLVYEWDAYPAGSVLAGQDRKRFVKRFGFEQGALNAYPTATVGYRDAHNTYSHLPGPDDPVPGGMYPDDYPDDHRDRAIDTQGWSY